MDVPFFRYPHVFEQRRSEVERALIRVCESGRYILQEEVRRFEEALAAYVGVCHVIGVGNATDGLELLLKAADIGPNDEVLIASHTFVATAEAVVAVGAAPVFAEIGEDHLMDPADAEARVTGLTRAVMPTQLNGRTADMDAFRSLADRHGLVLIEDSAQGLGSRFRGRMAGTFGKGGVYSFYPAKTLGALGDAGVVLTDDDETARKIRLLRDHGRDGGHGGEPVAWGRNSRLDNLQAAVLEVKLRWLDEEIVRRREIAARYHRNLAGVDGLVLPPRPGDGDIHFDVFQNYEVEADDRDALRSSLADAGVGTILPWGGKGVHQFPGLGVAAELPRTERVLARSFLLPMNTSLTDDEVDYVSERIRAHQAGERVEGAALRESA